MKKLLLIVGTILSLKVQALTVINISQFPNTSNPGSNYLIVLAQQGNTNYNMSLDQFSSWLANYPGFVQAIAANTNFTFNGLTSTNWPTQTNSGNVIWTNTTSFTNAGGNFISQAIYNPSPITHARLVISNSISTTITNTLPFVAYSISLGTNVTQAVVGGGQVLDLKFDYYNGTYFVEDYGKNNSTLAGLASSNSYSGALYITNGQIFIH